MSEIDFQNGLVVGLTIAGKNGAVGGVAPPPAPSAWMTVIPSFSSITLTDFVSQMTATNVDYVEP